MPKRTNAFQRLIHYIHEQNEGVHARVTESARLLEKNVEEPIEREIDVLIEKEVNGKTVRVAIECRDRASKDDIQWIDGLIGKYANLEVHKVIAVSNSGFTRSAFLKARHNNIELRTLEEAFDIDFENEFVKLGGVGISWNLTFKPALFEFAPPMSAKPMPEDKLYTDGGETSSLRDLERSCNRRLRDYISKNFLEIFRTRADLNKTAVVEYTKPIKGQYLKASDGVEHSLLSVTIRAIVKVSPHETNINQRLYEGALISTGVFDQKYSDYVYTLYATQVSGKKEVKITWKGQRSRKNKD